MRVQGSGFRVQGLGFRVWGLGFVGFVGFWGYLLLAGDEGVEKNIETTVMGFIGTTNYLTAYSP